MIDRINVDFQPPRFNEMRLVMQGLSFLLAEDVKQDVAGGGRPSWTPRIFPEGIPEFRFIGNTISTNAGDDFASASWGAGLAYARVQQYGASIPRTDAMRRFFWAKWYETQEPFWKNMALSRKATVDIPARSATSGIYERLGRYADFVGRSIIITEPSKEGT